MSTDSTPASPSSAAAPTVTCRVCGTEVPAGAYCGFCGAALSRQPGHGPDWLRAHAYGAAHAEHLLQLSLVSSLFPHLPHRSRAAFRWGLAGLIAVLAILAWLRWHDGLVAVSALGFPLLFLIYLEESDVYGDDDLPLATLLLTAVLGAAFGVVWALRTAPVIARSYSTFGVIPTHTVLRDALAIPVGGALLMLVPAVVVRLLRVRHLESLDGFLIGSLGAVAFTAAGTLVRLAPQLAHGRSGRGPTIGVLLAEAGIQGVAVPLTAAASGGLVGAALWYTAQRGADQQRLGRLLASLVPGVVVVAAVYAAVGFVDLARLPYTTLVAVHLLIAAFAVLALRIAIHLALLNETREEMRSEPVMCAECHHVVADTAFCPNCGVSMRATSRSSRQARLLPAASAAPSAPVAQVHRTSHIRLFLIFAASLAVVIAATTGVRALTVKHDHQPVCPQDCKGPPKGPPRETVPSIAPGPPLPTGVLSPPTAQGERSSAMPQKTSDAATQGPALPPQREIPPGQPQIQAVQPVQFFHRFQASQRDGGFSFAIPPWATQAKDGSGVTWTDPHGGDQAVLFGGPTTLTPREIAQRVIQSVTPNATLAYEIPNAHVGYEGGYGEVDNFVPQNSSGPYNPQRIIVLVAAKNGIAVVASATGKTYWPQHPTEHATGAQLYEVENTPFYYWVNSVRWKDDPPR